MDNHKFRKVQQAVVERVGGNGVPFRHEPSGAILFPVDHTKVSIEIVSFHPHEHPPTLCGWSRVGMRPEWTVDISEEV